MVISEEQMKIFIEKRGWYTFQSFNNWMNDEVMYDMTLDGSGLSLNEAFQLQIKLEKI
ncbi:hypothetical protein [Chryseobacterium sp.]|uniref:hypothetical protein n=1 Tax=Chryseobacterium sp. TaxID=1871047 RepID=UPI0024E27790|nr:hypothetical protein [Chryseobacterium sp.]